MSVTSWFMAQLYDRNIKKAEIRCLQDWRKALLIHLSGQALEIGCGTGLNLEFYPKTLDRLILLEPDINMRKKLLKKLSLQQNFYTEVLDCNAESIPMPDASCDAVVSMLVLCSVKDQNKALAEIYRILRPTGKLIFIEHVAAHNNLKRLKWQRRLEPLWKKITCGCHLVRPTEEAITQAGFIFSEISHQSMRGMLPIVRPSIKGIAVKHHTSGRVKPDPHGFN